MATRRRKRPGTSGSKSRQRAGRLDEMTTLREILMGEQSREVSVALADLEARFQREAKGWREETARSQNSIDKRLRRSIASLRKGLDEEQKARGSSGRQQASESRRIRELLENEVKGARRQIAASRKELEQRIERQGEQLLGELRKLSGSLRRMTDELAASKVDRKQLAQTFAALASSLDGSSSTRKAPVRRTRKKTGAARKKSRSGSRKRGSKKKGARRSAGSAKKTTRKKTTRKVRSRSGGRR